MVAGLKGREVTLSMWGNLFIEYMITVFLALKIVNDANVTEGIVDVEVQDECANEEITDNSDFELSDTDYDDGAGNDVFFYHANVDLDETIAAQSAPTQTASSARAEDVEDVEYNPDEARDKLILTSMEFIRRLLMKRIVLKQGGIAKHEGVLTPKAEHKLELLKKAISTVKLSMVISRAPLGKGGRTKKVGATFAANKGRRAGSQRKGVGGRNEGTSGTAASSHEVVGSQVEGEGKLGVGLVGENLSSSKFGVGKLDRERKREGLGDEGGEWREEEEMEVLKSGSPWTEGE
ncbi:uncharacterized protein A4U43_C07F37290 [Asparagus officinalis]|uniref:Uncharacterized protein n=1 Tax=Asparagus officinalis TaxID=4686 RepID=A0A5P1EHP8_ASPOF|nr:uncharacterized protein A4U43_C07F37290 [Asparagus officinalis]